MAPLHRLQGSHAYQLHWYGHWGSLAKAGWGLSFPHAVREHAKHYSACRHLQGPRAVAAVTQLGARFLVKGALLEMCKGIAETGGIY